MWLHTQPAQPGWRRALGDFVPEYIVCTAEAALLLEPLPLAEPVLSPSPVGVEDSPGKRVAKAMLDKASMSYTHSMEVSNACELLRPVDADS